MQLGMIGLGRMGGNIVRRLMKHGHTTVVYDKDPKAVAALAADGAAGSGALEDFVSKLEKPRTAWVMLPAGKITEATIDALSKLMESGDVIIDGGNTFWQDDVRRGKALKERGIHYLDVGTSGGVWGIDRGYCMMIGGDKAVVDRLDPIFAALAPGIGDIPRTGGREGRDARIEQGYIHAGPVGAGHFVKMIHNGIEYGLMQAYAEGFDILKNANIEALPSEHRFDLDIRRHRRGVAARQRDPVMAARSHRRRRSRRTIRSMNIPALWRIPAKAAGPSTRRSTRRCRPKCLTAALYRALPLAQGAHLRGKDSFRDARRFRRPQGAAAASRPCGTKRARYRQAEGRPFVSGDSPHQSPVQKKPDPCSLRHLRRHRRSDAPAGDPRAL